MQAGWLPGTRPTWQVNGQNSVARPQNVPGPHWLCRPHCTPLLQPHLRSQQAAVGLACISTRPCRQGRAGLVVREALGMQACTCRTSCHAAAALPVVHRADPHLGAGGCMRMLQRHSAATCMLARARMRGHEDVTSRAHWRKCMRIHARMHHQHRDPHACKPPPAHECHTHDVVGTYHVRQAPVLSPEWAPPLGGGGRLNSNRAGSRQHFQQGSQRPSVRPCGAAAQKLAPPPSPSK